MSLTPILAYTLLPVLALIGGLAMLFTAKAPLALQPALLGLGGVLLVLAFGSLSLAIALQAVRAHGKDLRD